MSHQQIFPACLPNTVTAAETALVRLKRRKWTSLRTTEHDGVGGGRGGAVSTSLSVGGRCHRKHKEHKMWGSAKANTLWPSQAFLGVSVHFPHSKHMSDHFPWICFPHLKELLKILLLQVGLFLKPFFLDISALNNSKAHYLISAHLIALKGSCSGFLSFSARPNRLTAKVRKEFSVKSLHGAYSVDEYILRRRSGCVIIVWSCLTDCSININLHLLRQIIGNSLSDVFSPCVTEKLLK